MLHLSYCMNCLGEPLARRSYTAACHWRRMNGTSAEIALTLSCSDCQQPRMGRRIGDAYDRSCRLDHEHGINYQPDGYRGRQAGSKVEAQRRRSRSYWARHREKRREARRQRDRRVHAELAEVVLRAIECGWTCECGAGAAQIACRRGGECGRYALSERLRPHRYQHLLRSPTDQPTGMRGPSGPRSPLSVAVSAGRRRATRNGVAGTRKSAETICATCGDGYGAAGRPQSDT